MRQYVRFMWKDEVCFGKVEKDSVRLLTGDFLCEDSKETDTVLPLAQVKLLAPVAPKNVLCIGLNYKSHAEESEMVLPDHPLIFIKTTTAVTGPEMPIVLPAMAPEEVDYEAELVIVIGKRAKNVPVEEAFDYIFGYTCGNDVSARDCQLREDSQWARGKSFDTFCPIGPMVVTGIDPLHLPIRTRLNGKVMQESNTENMIFNVPELVSFCSRAMTLEPGTIILSGTPEGVGFTRVPPVFLREGDTVEVEIGEVGTLKNPVVKEG